MSNKIRTERDRIERAAIVIAFTILTAILAGLGVAVYVVLRIVSWLVNR